MRKLVQLFAVVGIASIILIGCSGGDAPSTTPTTTGGGGEAPKAGQSGMQGAPVPTPNPQGG